MKCLAVMSGFSDKVLMDADWIVKDLTVVPNEALDW
jgi:hypothetical protein